MTLTINPTTTTTTTTPLPAELPADATMVLTAMEAGRHTGRRDRRSAQRRPLRVPAALRLYADGNRPTIVYTRDVAGRHVGFLCRSRVPLGYGGTITLGPDAAPVACVVLRCTPAAGGFYDCWAAFNRLQPQFESNAER